MDRIDAMAAFVAVADLEGFAPAARKLGLSPSNVTRLIAALEDRLGARLLQRTTRSVTLTDVGARYLERARRILADVEEAEISGAGRTDAAERAAGGLGADRIRPPPCQPGDVGVSAALSRGQRRTAAVGPHDQPGGRRRRSRGPDRPSRRFQPGRAQCRRHAADRGRLAGLSQAARRAETRRQRSLRTTRSSSAYVRLGFRRGRTRGSRAVHAALHHQQRRCRDPARRARRRPDAGAGLSGRRGDRGRPAARSCWRNSSRRRCRSTSSIRRRGCCRPRCGRLSIW